MPLFIPRLHHASLSIDKFSLRGPITPTRSYVLFRINSKTAYHQFPRYIVLLKRHFPFMIEVLVPEDVVALQGDGIVPPIIGFYDPDGEHSAPMVV